MWSIRLVIIDQGYGQENRRYNRRPTGRTKKERFVALVLMESSTSSPLPFWGSQDRWPVSSCLGAFVPYSMRHNIHR